MASQDLAICGGYAQCQCDVAEFGLSGDVAAFSGCGLLGVQKNPYARHPIIRSFPIIAFEMDPESV